MQVTIS